MDLIEMVRGVFERDYSIPNIDAIPIVDAYQSLEFDFNSAKRQRYHSLRWLMRQTDTFLKSDLAILFLKGMEFDSDRHLINFTRESNRPERETKEFFTYYAKKERMISKKIKQKKRFIDDRYSKNFLEKALEHKLICEDSSLWEKPDTSVPHLRFMSSVANRLFYMEDDLNKKIKFLEINYNSLLKTEDYDKEIDWLRRFNYIRRLFECDANFAICYLEKGDIELSKKHFKQAFDHALSLDSIIKLNKFYIKNIHPKLIFPVSLSIIKLSVLLEENPKTFWQYSNVRGDLLEIKNKLDEFVKIREESPVV